MTERSEEDKAFDPITAIIVLVMILMVISVFVVNWYFLKDLHHLW